jgi:ribonuclease inhibitor
MVQTVDLDVSGLRSGPELHELLATKLGFPGYYGRNWDAFWDCITDPDQSRMPSVLRVRGWAALAQRLPRDAKLMRECLLDLPSKRSDCAVE